MKCAGVLNRFHDHLSFSFRCYSRTAALSSFVALTSASACGLWLLRRAPRTLGQRKTRKFEIASVTCHAGLRQIQDHHVLAADIAHALLRRKVLCGESDGSQGPWAACKCCHAFGLRLEQKTCWRGPSVSFPAHPAGSCFKSPCHAPAKKHFKCQAQQPFERQLW